MATGQLNVQAFLDASAREKQEKKLLIILGKQFKGILLRWKKIISLFQKNDSKPLWLRYDEIAQDFWPGVQRKRGQALNCQTSSTGRC